MKNSNYTANREALKLLSTELKPSVKNGDYSKLNEAILAYYKQQGHEEFKTFSQWLKDGFAVKRGEKGFAVWGKPKKIEGETDEFDYFPICYLFSNKQVHKNVSKNEVSDISIVYKSKTDISAAPQISSSLTAYGILKEKFNAGTIEHHECFKVLLLNRSNKVLACASVSEGGKAATCIDVSIILQYALLANASSIILAHNHPSGNTDPSEADFEITNKVKEAAKYLEVMVLDHIILTKDSFYSFADNGDILVNE